MNTIQTYKLGDAVELVEMRKGYDKKDSYRCVRRGVVVELTDRVRVKWGVMEFFKNGVKTGERMDGKRTWMKPDRLTIAS